MKNNRFVVVGGGAAGFFAAIHAKAACPDMTVSILEAAPKVLGKVKISGGGRCNVTHACFDVDTLVQNYPRNARALKGVFSRFAPRDTVHWFESHGVSLKTEADGRMFPVTDESQTIIDCLVRTATDLGIQIHRETPVSAIEKTASGFRIEAKGRSWEAESVLIATGSSPKAYRWLKDFGHQMIDPVPSLFTFEISDPRLEGLAGISFPMVKGRLDLPGEKPVLQEGPLLITHWGLSGPLILRLSAWGARGLHQAGYRAEVMIDFLPDHPVETLQQDCLRHKSEHAKKFIANECPWPLPKRFWERLVESEDIPPNCPWGEVPNKSLNRLAETLKRCTFHISGKGVFKEEFVTAGGVPLKEINTQTMESRQVPGLYLAGEIIDVDGLTGGFNFQNAWSTGWIAGTSVAAKCLQEA